MITASKKTIIITIVIVASLTFYFVFSVFYLPDYYQSLKKPLSIPYLSEVNISESDIQYGESFDVKITSTNLGDSADIQIVSIAFPNLTRIDDHVSIISHDFRQSPFFIEIDDDVISNYASTFETIPAMYPSLEAYSRPWKSSETYHIGLEVTPDKAGKFVIFVKSVGLPHTNNQSHFPSDGLIDYQNEFVNVYSVNVTEP